MYAVYTADYDVLVTMKINNNNNNNNNNNRRSNNNVTIIALNIQVLNSRCMCLRTVTTHTSDGGRTDKN